MLKLLKGLLYLVVFAGVLAGSYLGFQLYLRFESARGGTPFSFLGTSTSTPGKPSAELAKPENAALASIVEDYKRSDAMPKPGTPDAAEVAAGAPATASTSSTIAAPGGVAVRPIRTPDPSVKLIREWSNGRKWVALTFDDGPNPNFTPKLIELLQSKNATATFFLLGPMVKQSPELAKQLVDAGFEVGNHTWKHPTLNKLSPEKLNEEIESTSAEIKTATGQDVKVMRPPYGSANKKVQDACDKLGLKIICWNIDTDDWRKETTQAKMEETIMKNLRDGSIILMHDRSEKALGTTANVIDKIRAQGYQFVTVSQLLGMAPVSATPAAPATPAAAPSAAATPAPVSAVALGTPPPPAAPPAVGTAPTPPVEADITPGSAPTSATPAAAGTTPVVLDVSPSKLTIPRGRSR